MMKSLKLKLFEFRKQLPVEQLDIVNVVSEHIDLCEKYSEKEIFSSLNNTLTTFKFYENVNTLLTDIDTELSENSLLYNLKDLYAKIARKEHKFLYENTLTSILECINQNTDEDRKIKILNELKIYEWVPEIKMFLYEMASTPQAKQNFANKYGKVNDVYSIVLQVEEGFLTYVKDKWFLLGEKSVDAVLLENYVKDIVKLQQLRLLEQAINFGTLSENQITFKIAEELELTISTDTKVIAMNGHELEKDSTLETVFNSPIIPMMSKGFYPILVESLNNINLFMNISTVKRVSNMLDTMFECYAFNYKGNYYQYRINKRSGNSFYKFETVVPLIESVLQELGADLTFFYENDLSDEIKAKNEILKKERVIIEKLNDVTDGILKIKEEKELLAENKTLKSLYDSLLKKKHNLSEELKTVKAEKVKLQIA